jgi:hypothetical protein
MAQDNFPDDLSELERARIRRRVVLAGVTRLAITVLVVALLAGIGLLLWTKVMISIDLHALR